MNPTDSPLPRLARLPPPPIALAGSANFEVIMAKKKSKTSVARKACQQIQQYARLSQCDENGYGSCCSCGEQKHYSDCDGGHFQPKTRAYNAACIDERNVHFQCKRCNGFLGGNPAGYSDFMIIMYGEEILEELRLLACQPGEREKMQEAYEKYRALNKELAKTKMFEVRLY